MRGGKKTIAVSEDVLDDFLNSSVVDEQSSSVDLGSVHNLKMFDEKEHPPLDSGPSEQSDSNSPLDEIVETSAFDDDVAAVDSGVTPVKRKSTKKMDADDHIMIEAGDMEVAVEEPEESTAEAKSDDKEEGKASDASGKKTKTKTPGRSGGWLGGAVLGAVAGTAACVAVWVFGIEPPSSLREMVGTAPAQTTPIPMPTTGGGVAAIGAGPSASATGFTVALDHIKNGELDRVKPEDLLRAEKSNPAHQVALAEYHWLGYLKSERGKNPKAALKADAEPVKKALEELKSAIAAKNPDALFLRGQIHEMTGKPDEAPRTTPRVSRTSRPTPPS